MKKDIHPVYYKDAEIKCACGNVIVTGSIAKELKTDICSACHPFYTGKQKLIDTAGRVDKFLARKKVAEDRAEMAKQALVEKKTGKKGDKYMTIEEMTAMKAKNAPKAKKAPEVVTEEAPSEAPSVVEKVMTEENPVAEAPVQETIQAEVAEIKAPKVKKATKKAPVKKPAAKKAEVKKPAKKAVKKVVKKAK